MAFAVYVEVIVDCDLFEFAAFSFAAFWFGGYPWGNIRVCHGVVGEDSTLGSVSCWF